MDQRVPEWSTSRTLAARAGDLMAWLPELPAWPTSLAALRALSAPAERLAYAADLAGHRHDFITATKIDRAAGLGTLSPAETGAAPQFRPLRIALLSSHSVEHLGAAIRVAGLVRRLLIELHIAPYGQYRQELLGEHSSLDAFAPQLVVLALDGADLQGAFRLDASADAVQAEIGRRVQELRQLWRRARERFGATVVQQTILNTEPRLFGNHDGLVAAAPTAVIDAFNVALRHAAREDGTLLLDLDWLAASQGRRLWTDPARWHQAKQLVSPLLAPVYGDQLARVAAASVGLSRKCLVLDLDNTVWGGVIGDDGLDGIVLGQGSAAGEAFAAFQHYCRALSDRGIILAVCSKNDQAIAMEAFEHHPEMVLKRTHIAAWRVNWDDKAGNVRAIAKSLNIGLDSIVFVDDNPAERAIVRQELAMVAVPELSEDVADYPGLISDAGYFEAAAFTPDDAQRAEQYIRNVDRQQAASDAPSDMARFLRDLQMVAEVGPIRAIDIPRVTQLVNKTNQFNLTTCRYSESEIRRFAADPDVITLQMRLADRFGDNGLIAVVIARPDAAWPGDVRVIDTWLMSCRVLNRGVERATLDCLAQAARQSGVRSLVGVYVRTPKNDLVCAHYPDLGFRRLTSEDGVTNEAQLWQLDVTDAEVCASPVKVVMTMPELVGAGRVG